MTTVQDSIDNGIISQSGIHDASVMGEIGSEYFTMIARDPFSGIYYTPIIIANATGIMWVSVGYGDTSNNQVNAGDFTTDTMRLALFKFNGKRLDGAYIDGFLNKGNTITPLTKRQFVNNAEYEFNTASTGDEIRWDALLGDTEGNTGKVYSGVWYRLYDTTTDGHVSYAKYDTVTGLTGWAGISTTGARATPNLDIMPLPITASVSRLVGDKCMPVTSVIEPYLAASDWVRNKNTDTKMFIGNTGGTTGECNGRVSFTYGTCDGAVFGNCDDSSKSCLYTASGDYKCTTLAALAETTGTSTTTGMGGNSYTHITGAGSAVVDPKTGDVTASGNTGSSSSYGWIIASAVGGGVLLLLLTVMLVVYMRKQH